MHPVIKLGNLSDQLKSQTYYGVCSDFTFDQDLCKGLSWDRENYIFATQVTHLHKYRTPPPPPLGFERLFLCFTQFGGVFHFLNWIKFRDTRPLDITGVSVPSSGGGNTFSWIIEDLESSG